MPLFVLPAAGVTPIVRFIDAARGPLVVNNYFLDSRPVLRAIAGKVRAGEKVWIILEPRPYRMRSSMISHEFAAARATGAYVMDAPPRFASGYTFDHAKYAVAANEVLIGTANWDWSAFHRNREYLYTSTDRALVRAMQGVAVADINRRPAGKITDVPGLVVTPGGGEAERKLASLLASRGRVMIETEEIQPANPLMRAIAAHGHDAEVLLPGRLSRREREAVSELRRSGVRVRTLGRPYMHAKMILAGGRIFIGSENFSTTSLERNREVGVISASPADIAVGRRQFARDWAAAGGAAASAASGGHKSAASTARTIEHEAGGYAARALAWHAVHRLLRGSRY